MGAAGNLPPPPATWQQLQSKMQNAAYNSALNNLPNAVLGGLGQAASQQAQPTVSMSGIEIKVRRKIAQAIDQLPMSICAQIAHIIFRFGDEHQPMRFDVIFTNQRVLSFTDVNAFPAEEHIARIALECP